MREIQLKDAKATFRPSSTTQSPANHRSSRDTGSARPSCVGIKEWERLAQVPSFGRLLMSAPIGPSDFPRRNRAPMRRVKF